jgi:hypothetical protein
VTLKLLALKYRYAFILCLDKLRIGIASAPGNLSATIGFLSKTAIGCKMKGAVGNCWRAEKTIPGQNTRWLFYRSTSLSPQAVLLRAKRLSGELCVETRFISPLTEKIRFMPLPRAFPAPEPAPPEPELIRQ